MLAYCILSDYCILSGCAAAIVNQRTRVAYRIRQTLCAWSSRPSHSLHFHPKKYLMQPLLLQTPSARQTPQLKDFRTNRPMIPNELGTPSSLGILSLLGDVFLISNL